MSEIVDNKFTLPLLITKGAIFYPGVSSYIDAGRPISVNAIYASKDGSDNLIIVTSQKNPDIDVPNKDDLYLVGTICRITSLTDKSNLVRIRIEPIDRVEISNIELTDNNFYYATGKSLVFEKYDDSKNQAVIDSVSNFIQKNVEILSRLQKNVINVITKTRSAINLCYTLLSSIQISLEKRQKALEVNTIEELSDLTIESLNGEKQKNEIESLLVESVRKSSEKAQKEYFLREKMRAIRKELGDTDDAHDMDKILENIEKKPYPENIKAKVKSEVKKFQMMPPGSLEGALVQNYIDILLSVPWYEKTKDNDDLNQVEQVLDEDHFGLEEPKKRILEYLAVKKLTGNLKSPILCFYGPPGCGKTSLGKSIARALGRKFFKASLGGISDEAEIRGHRRTYVGSMPGRIIQGMRKAGVTNPVFLLDEIDKLASSYKGDPASALLEVLDPEQNTAFNDNYIEEPYDLSDVLFICTANYLENIPGPLRDRLELIEVNSYTEYEKLHIAKDHLVSKQIELNGLAKKKVSFTDDALLYIIQRYTRESGVRELERKIANCLRKVAVEFVKKPKTRSIVIDVSRVKEYLKQEIFDNNIKEAKPQIGVVTGLAYTQYGGDILPIEVNDFKGKGGLVLTGHLGDVMKESCSIAFDYVKSNAEKYNIDVSKLENVDIHIHVPEGAVPKDGPSAGVAISLAIISCLSKTPVNPDVAMTGEVTLRGLALPIGGLREKSLAALRSGIKTIIVPRKNERDVSELPKEVKDNLTICYMDNVDDAYNIAMIKN